MRMDAAVLQRRSRFCISVAFDVFSFLLPTLGHASSIPFRPLSRKTLLDGTFGLRGVTEKVAYVRDGIRLRWSLALSVSP